MTLMCILRLDPQARPTSKANGGWVGSHQTRRFSRKGKERCRVEVTTVPPRPDPESDVQPGGCTSDDLARRHDVTLVHELPSGPSDDDIEERLLGRADHQVVHAADGCGEFNGARHRRDHRRTRHRGDFKTTVPRTPGAAG